MNISQAMIVKNEEKNIRRALDWGKGIVTEQIVVDTGSSDNTVYIAESMGARVYHFEWINDFSAAKNYAIEKCSGDWIAFLDADEYFMEDSKKIHGIIEKADKEGFCVIATQLLNINDSGKIIGSMTQARFFKNHEGIRYIGRIHENLSSDHPVKIYDATRELSIFHTGYSESAHKEKNKDTKYKELLEKEIEDNPYNTFYYGYLGDIYAGEQNYEKAEELYQRSMELMDDRVSSESGRNGNTLRNLLIILGGYNYRTEEMLKVYDFARRILPEDADFSCMVADHFYKFQNYKEAAQYYETALHIYDEFGAYLKSEYVDSHLTDIYEKLANAYLLAKNPIEAIKVSVKTLNKDKYNTKMLRLLLLSIKEAELQGYNGYGLNEEIVLINRMYDLDILRDKAFLYFMADKLGIIELRDFVKTKFTSEEFKIVGEK